MSKATVQRDAGIRYLESRIKELRRRLDAKYPNEIGGYEHCGNCKHWALLEEGKLEYKRRGLCKRLRLTSEGEIRTRSDCPDGTQLIVSENYVCRMWDERMATDDRSQDADVRRELVSEVVPGGDGLG